MRHNRKKVIERIVHEYKLLDHLIEKLIGEEWNVLLDRPESKDPWTIKDALAHITFWKADAARFIRRQPRPMDERGLNVTKMNHIVYLRWHNRSPKEVLAWHRQVQSDVITALKESPERLFSGRERSSDWPGDLDGHSAYHRIKDIELALKRVK